MIPDKCKPYEIHFYGLTFAITIIGLIIMVTCQSFDNTLGSEIGFYIMIIGAIVMVVMALIWGCQCECKKKGEETFNEKIDIPTV
jgi:predicted membrane channel-forming protein YqfA (hemolysin III family)